MRVSNSSSRENAFAEDCPTVMPTPVAERSTEDLGASANAGATSATAGTIVSEKLASDPADGSKIPLSSLSVLAGLEKGKGKDRESGSNSTKTDSTAIFQGEGTEESPYIVDWTENDPENPMRWVSAYHRLCNQMHIYRTRLFSLSG